MRSTRWLMLLTLLVSTVACGSNEVRLFDNAGSGEETEPGDESESPHVALHGEVHEFRFAHDDPDRVDFEAGADLLEHEITAEEPFRGVKMMATAQHFDVEYRLVRADGEPGPWKAFEPQNSLGKFHSGHLVLAAEAVGLHFRSNAPAEYIRFEFFEEPVDTSDSHDDHMDEQQDGVRHQAISRPGRYRPPSSVHAAGHAQEDNFNYEYAPSWSGGANCSGTFLPGARDLGNFLVDHFDGAAYFQGYNCRQIRGSSGMSMHGTGRAIDVFIPLHRGQADNDLGDPVANYLIENATELGVQFFVWDRSKWNIEYGEDRSYGGSHPHHDHLHIELTRGAARRSRDSFPGQRPQFAPHFADDDGSVHEQAINKIYEHGITRGCRGGDVPLYCPERTLKRGNMAVLFMRAFNLPRARQDYFNDDDGSYAEPAINAMAYRGITVGCDPDNPEVYCPGETVTRGQLVVFLDRALRLPNTNRDFYSDDDGAFYEEAANRVAASGITKGCAQNRFCGRDPITRGQLASFLARALGYLPGYDTQETDFVPYFADDDGNIHEEAINLLYEAGVTRGCGTGTSDRPNYCPERDIERAEIAVMLVRAFNLPDASADHFPDDDGLMAEPSINALAESGVTNGCGSGENFCPRETVSLGVASTFLMRAAAVASGGQLDADGMSQKEAVAELYNWQVITRPSCADPANCVNDVVPRDEAASLLVRVMSRLNLL